MPGTDPHRPIEIPWSSLPAPGPAEEGIAMSFNAFEAEINAHYARERVAAALTACQPLPARSRARNNGTQPAAAWLLRRVGRGLIVAGERLGGSAAPRPAPTAGPIA